MKKFLSMVLALAMAMSLVTFAAPAAGAKDFTDSSSIQYKEAVDVISAIQIMDGYNDASFGPTGTLTRGAAAKIICNMILGPTTASALPTNVAPFPDVPAGSTFAGYIAYCSEHSIISGYADGNFRPADSLSGYAFLKMLLCALGYDQEIEGYQGANWRVNVAKQALGIGLDDDLNGELDGSRIVTREEAALYAFNTLQSDMVEYDTKTSVSVGDAVVTVGGNKYTSRVASTQKTGVGNIDAATQNGVVGGPDIIQFAEEYFPQLTRFPTKDVGFAGGQGDFGEPSTRWDWKGVEVGTYPYKPAKIYSGDVKVSDIYNDLGLSGTANGAWVYLNGDRMFRIDIRRANGDKLHEQKDTTGVNNDGAYSVAGGFILNDGTAGNGLERYSDKVGDGTIIEVYHDDDTNAVLVIAKSVYPGQVSSTHARTSTKDAYIVIDQKQNGNTAVADDGDFNKNGHDEFTVDGGFEEDDMVWFTYSNDANSIGEVHKMESVEGNLTRRVHDKSVTLEGTTYNFGKEKAFDFNGGDDAMTTTSSYVVYRDGNGYTLWVEESDFAVDRYALIERIWLEGADGQVYYDFLTGGAPSDPGGALSGSTESARVRLLLSDGTTGFYNLDEMKRYRDADNVSGNGAGNGIGPDYDAGMVVRYNVNSNGTIRLYAAGTAAGSPRFVNTIQNSAADEFSIKDRVMHNLFRGYGTVDQVEVRADSGTIFVVKDPDTTKTYTGVRNAPNVEGNSGLTPYAYAYISSGDKPTAKVVFVEVSDADDVQTASKDITFLTHPSDPYEIDGEVYVDYSAVIKGVIQTIPVTVYEGRILNGSKFDVTYDDGDAPSVVAGDDYMTGSIILNKTNYDSDNYLTSGTYNNATVRSEVAQGIKKTNRVDEVKIDTHDDEITVTVASNVNVYYVDGDGVIAKITISEIRNDSEDMVYYTIDDGEITNLFIVDHDDDEFYMNSASIVGGVIRYTWNSTDAADNVETDFQAKKIDDKGSQLANALNWYDNNVSLAVYDAEANELTVSYVDGSADDVLDIGDVAKYTDVTDYD